MSRASKPSPTLPSSPVLPRWIRQTVGRDDIETVMFSAGAALAVLDPIARSEDPVGILWRKRLALSAAATVSGLEGRREGEAQLLDAFALRKSGDDPGPAGRMLIGWRTLGEARALRPAEWPARLPGFFDLPPEPASGILRDLGARFVGRTPPLRFAAEAAREVLALGPAHRGLALWLADALLARALGWDRPVPFLKREQQTTSAGDFGSNIYHLDGLVRKLKKLAPDFDDERAEREAARQKTERPNARANARAVAARQRTSAAKTEG